MKYKYGVLLLASLFGVASARAQSERDYEAPPISYSETAPNDVIARLQERLNSREFAFTGTERETVRALLRELKVPAESQMLLFSKTSVQRARISPQNPRAVYFNDTCYVGWVPGGLVEVAAIDPQLGPVFYTLDPLERGREPQRFRRDANCLSCHAINFTREFPGVFARSVFADATGSPVLSAGSQVVDYRTPFEERWGGWYVTGRHGAARHRGNAFVKELPDGGVKLDVERGANLDSLKRFIDPSYHLMPTSDIVALLVFEHQIAVHQALTRANYECRRMLAYQHGLQKSFKEPVTDEPAYDSVKSVFAHRAEALIDALLYKDEAKLPEGGVRGADAFRRVYEATGPKTADGRSLRELDLKTRIARYRCSPLIYTEQFRQLPPPLLSNVLDRLHRVLYDPQPEDRYAYLGQEERKAIAAILCETMPNLPETWRR